ncbi:toll/interleukin-1 receptor domain-containing protein [uncultured Tateyamaria sp.]|uniref:toll/interleukin-1 receptor domain-containing protein n=1 Tax=uncultured Tateyamaria sp. TaxID=455651 RepID=UPI002619124B|nr:toll/interleukin-1 receptor domain-containing protein [uncultured Tateyamaria sp.]
MFHQNEFYNFICSAFEDNWEKSPTTFVKYRVFEYTEPSVLEALVGSKTEILEQMVGLPTLFVYEDMVDKLARVGTVTGINEIGSEFHLSFELSEEFEPISNEDLANLTFELDLEPFEFSRTHWAVKHVNLLKTLEQRGFRIPKSNTEGRLGSGASKPVERSDKTTKVFISYSHADVQFLDRLKLHLKPLMDRLDLEIWSDTKLVGGDDWKAEIEVGLSNASVAILIVSADFLASDFIAKFELPPLLEKHEKDGCRIIPVIAKPCFFAGNAEISRFQAVNDPKDALQSLTEAKREEVFAKVAQLVNDLAS